MRLLAFFGLISDGILEYDARLTVVYKRGDISQGMSHALTWSTAKIRE